MTANTEIHLKDYAPHPFRISQARLIFRIQSDHTEVESTLEVEAQGNIESSVLELSASDMDINSVSINGNPTNEYEFSGESLTISGVPPKSTVTIVNTIDPSSNKSLEGLYQSGDMLCTQCEPEGFRRITPFIDQPDNTCRFSVRIEADKNSYPILLSNGNPGDSGDLDDGRHYTEWNDPHNKPSYLFALVAGDLAKVSDTFKTTSGTTVPLNIYVDHGNEDRCSWAMDSLKRSMKWDEDVFGLEYDLDVFNIVAVEAFNMGAMENKGLNIFNAQAILAKPETATDANFQNIEGIVAHEYFHNWTGNRVTCRDWFQLTLKEGLTVFRDQEFSSDMNSRPVCRIGDVAILRNHQFPEDSGPNSHPIRPASYVEINNFYTSTVYQKGSEIIRMMHTLIGSENFRKGMDLYFKRHDGQAVTCEEFVASMADASGTNLDGILNSWYRQAGTPTVTVKRTAHDKDAGTLTLTITQKGGEIPYTMPLAIGLIGGGDTREIPVTLKGETEPGPTTRVLTLDSTEHTFNLIGVHDDVIVSANRGFSAPVNLITDTTATEDLVLMSIDTDPVNRWEAGQRLATNCLESLVTDYQAGRSFNVDKEYLQAIGHVLNDPAIDPAYRAELLAPPSLTRILEGLATYDIDAADAARKALRKAVAETHRDALETLYRETPHGGTFEINAEAFGRRRLRSLALSILMELDDEGSWELLRTHRSETDNMTDEENVLFCALNWSLPEREEIVSAFRNKWKDESLVMNKWFGAQASSRNATPESLEKLFNDSAFDQHNPNKIRALVGLFSSNLPRFHDASGSGYRWFADKVLATDSFNPTLAGRLAKAFDKFSRLDSNRRKLLSVELERILATDGLSKDVTEIIGNTLKSQSSPKLNQSST